jgi:hypothetical protein
LTFNLPFNVLGAVSPSVAQRDCDQQETEHKRARRASSDLSDLSEPVEHEQEQEQVRAPSASDLSLVRAVNLFLDPKLLAEVAAMSSTRLVSPLCSSSSSLLEQGARARAFSDSDSSAHSSGSESTDGYLHPKQGKGRDKGNDKGKSKVPYVNSLSPMTLPAPPAAAAAAQMRVLGKAKEQAPGFVA